MKKHICFIFFIFTCQLSYSQACGGGIFEIEFYTKNGNNLQYKIIEIKIKNKELLSGNIQEGILINKNQLEEINQSEFDKSKLPNFISGSIIDKDVIKDNKLTFNTLELYNKLFLLKVWNAENEIYVLANLFGRCSRRVAIVMIPENPQLISIQ